MSIGLVSCLLLLVAALVALVLLGWRRWHDRRERARIIGILPRDEGQLDGGTVAQHDIARSKHKGGKKCRSLLFSSLPFSAVAFDMHESARSKKVLDGKVVRHTKSKQGGNTVVVLACRYDMPNGQPYDSDHLRLDALAAANPQLHVLGNPS